MSALISDNLNSCYNFLVHNNHDFIGANNIFFVRIPLVIPVDVILL